MSKKIVYSSIKCPKCGAYYPAGKNRKVVIMRLDGAQQYGCKECGKVFYR
jgi:transposase-like protein